MGTESPAKTNTGAEMSHDNGTTFGSRLAGRRRTLRQSQGAVARSVGVSPRFLSKLENDGGRPSWEVAVRLADALDVSLDYLAGRSG